MIHDICIVRPFFSYRQTMKRSGSRHIAGFSSLSSVFNRHFEWFVLLAGLLMMAVLDPRTAGEGYCLLEWMGITWCPGDGLGRSIAWATHGEFYKSLEYNIMGIPSIIIIGGRVLYLVDGEFHLTDKIRSLIWPE